MHAGRRFVSDMADDLTNGRGIASPLNLVHDEIEDLLLTNGERFLIHGSCEWPGG